MDSAMLEHLVTISWTIAFLEGKLFVKSSYSNRGQTGKNGYIDILRLTTILSYQNQWQTGEMDLTMLGHLAAIS